MGNEQLEQNKKEGQQSFITKVVIIGLFGGVFWSLVWYVFHIFSFSQVGPNYLLLPFAFGNWKNGVWGQFAGVVVLSVISILLALLYGAFLKKFQGISPGIIFGLAIWAALFLGMSSFIPSLKGITDFTKETLVTTGCLYILYGVFIAYSVSYEASEQNRATQGS
ncbi:YqhR family membrane protein [Bacillus sp. 165]|uniref:YqhR family membrane protein n=1 Tax=Bacillus sp. 165 TaxID=1529117 RepID=UPI001ADA402C|nr:YqhR family membrane protein [Bacillus sp. 165]MBO9129694.1 hypothetical protein [Bacillus sp. 165]